MFFTVAKKGNNSLFRYLATFIITIFLGYSFIGQIPLIYRLFQKSGYLTTLLQASSPSERSVIMDEALEMFSNPLNYPDLIGSRNETFFLMTFIFFIAAVFFHFSLHFIQHKKLQWVLTGAEKFRWNNFFFSFGLGGVFILVNVLFLVVFEPDQLIRQFEWQSFIPLLLIALLMIPIQAGFEEAFFRGWMMQGFGLLSKNRGMALLITSLLFASVHMANPEVQQHGAALMFPMYFTMALTFGILTLMSDGLELSMGLHIANNLFLVLLITSPESALQTDSIYRLKEVQEIRGQIGGVIFMNIITLLIFAWQFKWTNWSKKLFGSIEN